MNRTAWIWALILGLLLIVVALTCAIFGVWTDSRWWATAGIIGIPGAILAWTAVEMLPRHAA